MMNTSTIAHQRLLSQHIAGTPSKTPGEVVQWLGAVQAQDYEAAKWAVGLRTLGTTDADVEQAISNGALLRTHVLRPTWHFVTPEDIRWMLGLTAPRVNAASAYYYRALELDDQLFQRSNAVLEQALQGGKHLTRTELLAALQQAGVNTEGLRSAYLMMRAELDGVICSGARRGKQITYALLSERAPQAKALAREEALEKLTTRYFTGHGPATVQDFVWWSGLTTTDAKAGLELAKAHLAQEVIEGTAYWFAASLSPVQDLPPSAYLLPNYDEYIVGYADRGAIFDPANAHKLDARGSVLAQHTMVSNGRIVGTWKRTLQKGQALLAFSPFTALSEDEHQAFLHPAAHFSRFTRLPVTSL
jgi:hypothetical protein